MILAKGQQLDKLLAGVIDRGKGELEMKLPNGVSGDRHAWAAGIHGRKVYRDDRNDVDAQLLRLERLPQMAQREMARG